MKNSKDFNSENSVSAELIDRYELARRLNVDPRTVYNLGVRKIIPLIRIGRLVRYDWEAVFRVLINNSR